MTQEEFAAAIQVKEGTLAAWETDRAHPRSRDIVEVAKRIEALTTIPTAWILGIEDGPPAPPPPGTTSWPTAPPPRPVPVRHLRSVIRTDPRSLETEVNDDVNDDALAYIRLAGAAGPSSDQPT
ncbi:helix-turn-helix transcriptional regulator, partial [Mycobacterium intracellulare]